DVISSRPAQTPRAQGSCTISACVAQAMDRLSVTGNGSVGLIADAADLALTPSDLTQSMSDAGKQHKLDMAPVASRWLRHLEVLADEHVVRPTDFSNVDRVRAV